MITVDARWVQTSGMGTYLRNLLPGLLLNFSDQRFTLLGNRQELESIGFTGNQVTIVDATAGMYSIQEQIDYWKLIPRETRLYFSTHYNVPLFYRGRMLVTVYDLFHLAMPDLVGGMHKRLYAKLMFNAVHRKASAIITISEFTRNELVRLTGPCTQPVHPIHLGVDREWSSIPPSSKPHGKPYVLYVGNIKPHKNLGRLVQAFSSIADTVPHDLILVGKREGFITGDSDVAMLSRSLGARVIFTGRVSDEELRQYFSHADALAFPSLYEGFGFPPVEAMAAGCPTLVSNIGPMPEVCGDASLYCNPLDVGDIATKLLRLLQDQPLRATLRERGLLRASALDWDSCIKKTCTVIDGLLEGSK